MKNLEYIKDFEKCLALMNRKKEIFHEIKQTTSLQEFSKLVIEDRLVTGFMQGLYKKHLKQGIAR